MCNAIIGFNAENFHFVYQLLQKHFGTAVFFLVIMFVSAVLNNMHKQHLAYIFTQATDNVQRF